MQKKERKNMKRKKNRKEKKKKLKEKHTGANKITISGMETKNKNLSMQKEGWKLPRNLKTNRISLLLICF